MLSEKFDELHAVLNPPAALATRQRKKITLLTATSRPGELSLVTADASER